MSDLTKLTIAEARDGLRAREFSAAELTEANINAAEEAAALNLYITETFDLALSQAKVADERVADGTASAMTGIPIAVKDLFCTKGIRTTAGSNILNNFVPAYESTVTGNLFRAGAVMLGKSNMDEFAMGSSNETSFFGPVINPWRARGHDKNLVPGGSSGGSAAAVAARTALGAIGTDTGGSIRQPGSVTGTVGLKPSYGRCSRWGVAAFASSLDHPGPITRTVRDAAIMLQAMASYDEKDSTSIDRCVPDYEGALSADVRGMTIGVPKEYRLDDMPVEIEKLWSNGVEWLRDAGATIKEISLPHTKYALPAYYIVAPAEASSNLARYDGVRFGLREAPEDGDLTSMYEATRAAGFGHETRRRIIIGTYVLSAGYYDAYYLKAQRVRQCIAEDFRVAFKDVNAILTPTAPNAAFPIGEKMDDPIAMYLNDIFTVPADMAGIPAISVPAGLDDQGLPLGLQIMGPAFEEETVLRVAHVLEKAASFDAAPLEWWKG